MRRRNRRQREVQIETPRQAPSDDRSWFDRRPRLTLVIGVALTAAVMGLMYDAWRDQRPIVVQDRPSLFGAPRNPDVIQAPAPDPEHQTSLAGAALSKSRRPGGGQSGVDPRLVPAATNRASSNAGKTATPT